MTCCKKPASWPASSRSPLPPPERTPAVARTSQTSSPTYELPNLKLTFPLLHFSTFPLSSEAVLHAHFHRAADQNSLGLQPVAVRVALLQHGVPVQRVVEIDVERCAPCAESQDLCEPQVHLIQPFA